MYSIEDRFFVSGYYGTLVAAIICLIIVWILTGGREWCQKEWRFLKSASMMPGPPAFPFIGNALHFACKGDGNVKWSMEATCPNDITYPSVYLLKRIVELCQPYNNPFRFWLGTKLVVTIRNPRDMEVVFNSPIATNKPYEYRFLASYLGPGIVTNSGAGHRALRKLVMPMVTGKPMHTFIDCFDRQSQRCVECLEERVDTGEFDIIHYMDNCTLDMILETIMGTPGTAQNNGYKGVIDCCTRAITLAHERSMKVWLHPQWIYNRTNVGKQFTSAMKILHEFVETFIAEKRKEYFASESLSNASITPSSTVLQKLIAHNGKTKLMNDIQLRDEMANIWMPAQDPTALTSSFLFLMLGMHPEVQDKVRAEVREVIRDGDITVEQISKLKYLDMVFKETVRLFPVGPVILRELQEDLEFETCTAPKGCTLALIVYMAHRDPNYWTDPEKFNPDRFTPENSLGRHRYAYVPFSNGVRGCIGQQFATALVKTLAVRVIQKYRISSKGSLETLRLKAGVSVRSIDGYMISITRL